VYDLLTCPPHEPPGLAFTREQWPVYVAGYTMALQMAMKVMELALVRFDMVRRTRRLEAKRRRDEAHSADATPAGETRDRA
jgi:hypothetical protein